MDQAIDVASSNQKIQNDLSMLIGTSGKLRMLSHRVIMFVLMDINSDQENLVVRKDLANAIREFKEIAAILGGADPSIGDALEFLKAQQAVTSQHLQALERFLTSASRIEAACLQPTTSDLQTQISEFAQFVATDLLATLNDLNARISKALQTQISQTQVNEGRTREMVHSTLSEIEKVSLSIRLIALNASVEASRAGEHGMGFSVIADEVKRLSESTQSLLEGLKGQLEQL